MRRKLRTCVIAIGLLVLSMATEALAVDSFTRNEFNCSVLSYEEKTVSVTVAEKYRDQVQTLDVPETVSYAYQTYTVVELGILHCPNLEVVNIPSTVREFARRLNDVPKLKEYNFDPENPYYTSVDGVIYDKTVTTLIFCPKGRDTVTVPEGVTTIGEDAFSNTAIKEIYLPETLLEIQDTAFFSCNSLSSIKFPDGLLSIGEGAFMGCTALKSLVFPEKLKSIESNAFNNCCSLVSIVWPKEIDNVSEGSFSACTSLKKVTLPENITSIMGYAFAGDVQLSEIYIPAGVTKILMAAFGVCQALTSFTVDERNEYFCAENGMLLSKDKTILNSYPSAIGDVILPEGITTIEDFSMSYCKVTSVTLPSTTTNIGRSPFLECDELDNLICLASCPPELTDPLFFLIHEDTSFLDVNIYVPEESLEAYLQADGWRIWGKRIHSIESMGNSVDKTFGERNYGCIKVYDLKGSLVANLYESDQLKALGKGLYIIVKEGKAEKIIIE